MARKKSGVLLYFKPLHKEVLALSDTRCAALFRAVMEYADPETQKDTDFDDETLQHIWTWLKPSLDRDDETYMRKVAGKYASFCRFCKEKGYGSVQEGKYVPPLNYQEWEDAGRPTAKQWISVTLDTPNNTNAYEPMRSHTDAYEPMRSYAPHENAENRISDSTSLSDSLSDSFSGAGAGTHPDAWALPAALKQACLRWVGYIEDMKGSVLPPSSRTELESRFLSYAQKYGYDAVANLVGECISEGQKVLYWDRLERNARKYQPTWQRGGKNVPGDAQRRSPNEAAMRKALEELRRDGGKAAEERRGRGEGNGGSEGGQHGGATEGPAPGGSGLV